MLKRCSLHSESREQKFCLMLQTKYRQRTKEKLSPLATYANYSISMWHDATLNNNLDINNVLLTERESRPFFCRSEITRFTGRSSAEHCFSLLIAGCRLFRAGPVCGKKTWAAATTTTGSICSSSWNAHAWIMCQLQIQKGPSKPTHIKSS